MTGTFAGQNACNAKNHDRPFVIEWDATDVSSFESRASTDVVFVHYEGCNLQIIDTCTNDSVRGAFGSYLPVDWTSGSLEKIDVANEAELYAKLPLGTSLASRVRSGEEFHMEYFVSGTRHATRPYVYTGEIDKIPGCRGVTHVVYAYNVGAFALGSLSKAHAEQGATLWGAGRSASNQASAEKRGGDLPSCRGESAKEVDSCKNPIRLALREIQAGDNPDVAARAAPETPDALNLAGKLQASSEHERAGYEHLNAAQQKLTAGDGAGCLRELDEHDALDPRPGTLSTSPKSSVSMQRATCLMASGRCDAGKTLARKWLDGSSPPGSAPQALDQRIDILVAMYCAGSSAQPRDQILYALFALSNRNQRSDVRACRAELDTVERFAPSMKKDDPSSQITGAWRAIYNDAPACFARAGNCTMAWAAQKESAALVASHGVFTPGEESVRSDFTSHTREQCFNKPEGTLTPREEVWRSAVELELARQTAIDPATCRSIYERARGVVLAGRPAETDLGRAATKLREGAMTCFVKAQDCAQAWRASSELLRWLNPTVTDRRLREEFDQNSSGCRTKPQGALSPRERIFYLDLLLTRARGEEADKGTCLASFRELKQLLGPAAPEGDNDLHSVRQNMAEHATRCLVQAHACTDAQRLYHAEERARFDARGGRPVDDAAIDAAFERNHRECKP